MSTGGFAAVGLQQTILWHCNFLEVHAPISPAELARTGAAARAPKAAKQRESGKGPETWRTSIEASAR